MQLVDACRWEGKDGDQFEGSAVVLHDSGCAQLRWEIEEREGVGVNIHRASCLAQGFIIFAPDMGKFGKRQGVRQRLGLRPRPKSSALCQMLKKRFLDGHMTAPELQATARAAGSATPGLQQLAKGKVRYRMRRGENKVDNRNAARATTRVLAKTAVLNEPYMVKIPGWDDKKNERTMLTMSILPLHETLDCIVKPGAEAEWTSFSDTQQGLKDDLRQWGQRVQVDTENDPWACIALWGDAAPYTKRDSLYLLLFTVLNGRERERIWIAAFSKRVLCRCGCFGRCTLDGIWDIVAWSMKALLVGRWPTLDHLGQPLTGWRREKAGQPFRFRAAVIASRGDWAWNKQILGVRGWMGEGPNKYICWLCDSRMGDRDFTHAARSRSTTTTTSSFATSPLEHAQFVSRVWRIPGFVLAYIKADWTHTVCLGTLQQYCGNVMWELATSMGATFRRWEQPIGNLMNMVKAMARTLGVEAPFHQLTMGMIRASAKNKPRMKLKAAEGRYFLPVLVHMLKTYFACESPRDQARLHCGQALCRCYYYLRNWDAEENPTEGLERAARQHLILYADLSYTATDEKCWRLMPKHHLMVHVSAGQTINPATLWNYTDEDEIGRAATIANKCNVRALHTALVAKYRLRFS